MAKSVEMAAKISGNGPVAVAKAKEAIDYGLDLTMYAENSAFAQVCRGSGLFHEKTGYQSLLQTSDRLEGLQAFAAKRPPAYTGK